tara:strand:- start:615 stop:1313 length:699 start_codon:yes stop_codon:yes gene_type:complete
MTSLTQKRANAHLSSIGVHHSIGANAKLQKLVDYQSTVTNQIKIGTAAATATISDGEPAIADDSEREGWLFQKVAAGSAKINWYFYGQGNTQMTLGSLTSINATMSIDTYSGQSSLPFFHVYTVATGSGDGGAWYKSRITYTLSAGQRIILGEAVNAWCITKLDKATNNLRNVEFNNTLVVGPADPSETILTIALGSDSAAPAGIQMLIKDLGFRLQLEDNTIINNKIKLIA